MWTGWTFDLCITCIRHMCISCSPHDYHMWYHMGGTCALSDKHSAPIFVSDVKFVFFNLVFIVYVHEKYNLNIQYCNFNICLIFMIKAVKYGNLKLNKMKAIVGSTNTSRSLLMQISNKKKNSAGDVTWSTECSVSINNPESMDSLLFLIFSI